MQKIKHKIYKKRFGCELEGAIPTSKRHTRAFHPDGSVHVVHNSPTNYPECECYQYCECEQCTICEGCDNSIDCCDCDSCLRCNSCDRYVELQAHDQVHLDTGCECYPPSGYVLSMSRAVIRCVECIETEFTLCDTCTNLWRYQNMNTEYHCAETHTNCDRRCSCSCNCSDNDVDESIDDPDLTYCCDGELTSPVYKRISSLQKWADINYPVKTNRTCGGHFHVSFDDLSLYSKLIEPEFPKALIAHLHKFGVENKVNPDSSLFKRLAGGCDYALLTYHPEEQLFCSDKGSGRYTAVNYCWGVHKTIEIRVLPAFQKKYLYISILKSIDVFIDRYLESKEYESQDIGVTF